VIRLRAIATQQAIEALALDASVNGGLGDPASVTLQHLLQIAPAF
jgi:hypothetical protein